jgi:hypothetical protein
MSSNQVTLNHILEKKEVLLSLKEAVKVRLAYSNEDEQMDVESLSNRALYPQCSFDRRHRLMILALALAPDQVTWSFRLREKLHRLIRNYLLQPR